MRFVTGTLRFLMKRAATAADIGMERSLIIFQFGSHALNLDLKGNKISDHELLKALASSSEQKNQKRS